MPGQQVYSWANQSQLCWIEMHEIKSARRQNRHYKYRDTGILILIKNSVFRDAVSFTKSQELVSK